MIADDLKLDEVRFEREKISSQFDRDKSKLNKDHELLVAKENAELLKNNLDDNVMRYKAMEATKAALSGKKFECATMKSEGNDVVTQMAAKWFAQK